MELKSNKQLDLAREFLHSTGVNIFLTGGAGTGKTTFLRNTITTLNKRTVVAAPTGVAAINAGGVTLHSLFALPFSPYIPNASARQHSQTQRFKISRRKIALIRSIELLVIDEISMVRCDMMDAIDETLRRVRRSGLPFGGVQLLMIGDVKQLSPICQDSEWEMLREFYTTPYFFDSHVLKKCGYITIELQEIFRQSDTHFTSLLNAIRENAIDDNILKCLNQRYIPNFNPPKEEGYITLSTHNHSANRINTHQLNNLPSDKITYTATIKGDYPSHSYPTDETLELKVGAQVIFIKNDPSPEKLYYNGLIGEVTSATDTQVTVTPKEGGAEIKVSAVAWENIEYTLNTSTGEIEESIKGSFTQLPLRCAWAITIHKSQGLSFDRAIIDANSSFAHGQVYVALSRCRTLEGMVLSSPLSPTAVIKDSLVENFSQYVSNSQPSDSDLDKHKQAYLCTTLCELFNFDRLHQHLTLVVKLLSGHLYLERPKLCNAFAQCAEVVRSECIKFADAFQRQIINIISSGGEADFLQERLCKASQYFQPHLIPIAPLMVELSEVEPDAQELKKQLAEATESLREELAIKVSALKLCEKKFTIEEYQRNKVNAIAQGLANQEQPKKGGSPKSKKTTTTSSDITHKELYNTLVAWRRSEADDADIKAFMVLSNRTLVELQSRLPRTITELKKVPGIGDIKLRQFGEQILLIINDFCFDSGID